MNKSPRICAVIPAAGKSIRMGLPKICLPWRKTTVIGHIIETLTYAHLEEIIVVIDASQLEVMNHLEFLLRTLPFRLIQVPESENNEMLTSIQTGIKAINGNFNAVLIALADQPQMQFETVNKIISNYSEIESKIIIPSFNLRRGHPWLIDSTMIDQLLQIKPPLTARKFLLDHSSRIQFVEIGNDSILQDIDTPSDYRISLVKDKLYSKN